MLRLDYSNRFDCIINSVGDNMSIWEILYFMYKMVIISVKCIQLSICIFYSIFIKRFREKGNVSSRIVC